MKIYIISFILLITFQYLFSQQIVHDIRFDLYQTDSHSSKEYVARDQVIFYPGYQFNGYTDGKMIARIDPNQIFLNNPTPINQIPNVDNVNVNTNENLSFIPGEINVSSTGSAVYTIPIELPQGTNGMTPELSLTYNSQTANGLLGWGWNLNGLSSIFRTHKTKYFDNNIGSIEFNSNDRLVVDGERLILQSGNYFEPNSTYAKENYDFSNIKFLNNNDGFLLYTKDGIEITYGQGSAKLIPVNYTIPYAWFISKIKDRNGNYIEYVYNNQNGEIVINEIKYTKNETNALPYYTVRFYYEEKSFDKNKYFIYRQPGTMYGTAYINANNLLKRIEISFNGQTISTYELNYTNQYYTKLYEIIKKGNNNQSYNSTLINYGNSPNNKPINFEFSDFSCNYTYIPSLYNDYFNLDFNNDGFADCVIGEYEIKSIDLNSNNSIEHNENFKVFNKLLFFKNNKDNSFSFVSFINPSSENSKFIVSTKNSFSIPNQQNYFCSNFTNDNNDDFVVSEVGFENNMLVLKKIIIYNDLFQPMLNNITNIWNDSYKYIRNNFLISGDFDGDGKTDLLTVLSNNTMYKTMFYTSSKNQTKNVSIGPSDDNFSWHLANAKSIKVIDFNGNGKADVVVVFSDNDVYPTRTMIYELSFDPLTGNITPNAIYSDINELNCVESGDFNGDGKSDLIIDKGFTNSKKYFQIYYSTGVNFKKGSDTLFFKTNFPSLKVVDFNGDGKSDILICEKTDNNQFNTNEIFIGIYYFFGFENIVYNRLHYPPNAKFLKFIGDFNGDGNYDFIFDNDNDHNQRKIVYCNKDNFIFWVKKIRNGLGQIIYIDYKTISNNSIYNNSTQNAHPIKRLPLFVVSQLKIKNSNLLTETTQYNYSDGLSIEEKNLPIIGFAKIEAYKTNTATKTTDYYIASLINYRGLLPVKNEYSINFNNQEQIISKNEIQYDYYQYFNNKCFFLYPKNINKINLINNIYSENNNAYNIDGNLTYSIIKKGIIGNQPEITTETNYYYTSAGLSIPNKISSFSTTSTYQGQQPYSTTETFQYDPTNGSLTQHLKDDVLYSYEYYSIGTVKKEIISSNGLPTKTTEYQYDPTYRFITKKTLPSGFVSSFLYNIGRGLLLSETDINGLVTTYEYDYFDRLYKTTYPDGTINEKNILWCTNNSVPDALYYTFETKSNSPYIKTYYDARQRVIRTETIDVFDRKVYNNYKYNLKNQLIEESEPYFANQTPRIKTYSYLPDGRIQQKNIFGTNIINYSYNGLTTTETNISTGTISQTSTNSVGQIIQSRDDGGIITYTYSSLGLPISVSSNGATTIIEYDQYGRQRFLHDPDAGTIEYKYNCYNQLEYQMDAKGNRYDFYYDVLGRLIKKTATEGNYQYFYDEDTQNKGLITRETSPSGQINFYKYDALGRLIKKIVSFDNKNFDFFYEYDNSGNLIGERYPGDFGIRNIFNPNGFLLEKRRLDNNNLIWHLDNINNYGQILTFSLGNNLVSNYSYDNNYLLTTIETGNIQKYMYYFDPAWQRPVYRYNQFGYGEDFQYDVDGKKLNRLSKVIVAGEPAKNLEMQYAINGNMIYKKGVGSYQYSLIKPHAVSTITNIEQYQPINEQTIFWNTFNKAQTLTEGEYRMELNYGINQQRIKTSLYYQNQLQKTKYFADNYEQVLEGNSTKHLYYIDGPYGLVAILLKDNQHPSGIMYYIHKDHLGSITEITDNTGALVQRFCYDAWGGREMLIENTGNGKPLFDRGYTGHEHLDQFSLINMNGRLYDPVVARMLSPDNFVQNTTNTQGFNRYSYCLNNPLIYTDPSGEFVWVPVIIGAVVGAYMGGTVANQGEMNPIEWDYNSGKTWGYMLGGAVVGGVSGYFGYAVATSGMPMANTAGLMAGSFTNSVGMNMVTGGQTPVSVSFGVASYNFDNNEWGYLGKKGNSTLENIGYGFGALANLADINQVINSTQAKLYTDESDFISHSAIVDKNTGDPLMSFGPNDTKVPNTKLGYATYFRRSTSDFHYNPTLPVDITVNKYAIDVVRGLGRVLPFQGITTNCVNMASLSLWLNGIPNIGLSPWLLYGTTWAYTAGIRPDLYSYYFTQYGR
ncbi:MAG TPA: FG-GAP-like repeat-containing protein [Bacteroidales bacterium]|nr:FG-GAP-like repeat-containing protein [Bacteroidales bacterium]